MFGPAVIVLGGDTAHTPHTTQHAASICTVGPANLCVSDSPKASKGGTPTEFGDLPMFVIAVLPWPDRKKTGLPVGVGPTFVFPTATSKSAGQGAWQVGPALGAIYGWNSGTAGRIRCPESDWLRVHLAHRPPSKRRSTWIRAHRFQAPAPEGGCT
jgi:hypothetical protein